MTEKESYNPLDELIKNFSKNTDFWSTTFVESNWKKTGENNNQIFNREYDFSRIIFQETRYLIEDILSENIFPSDQNLSKMKSRKRINNYDFNLLSILTDDERKYFFKHFSQESMKKINSLTDYLTYRGNTEAIPLSFLAGTPLKTLSGFQKINSQDRDAKNRNLIVSKAELLYENGGEILFPSWKNADFFPALLTVAPSSGETDIKILTADRIVLNDRVKGATNSSEMLRAMIHPKRIPR